MKVLIFAQLNDAHAEAAVWALANRGIKADTIYSSDFPQRVKLSFDSCIPGFELSSSNLGQAQAWDVVWNRRTGPCAPYEDLFVEDRKLSKFIGGTFFEWFRSCLDGKGWWINGVEVGRHAENKVAQLILAQQVGLKIPSTLISNDHEKIYEFVSHQESCIVKPLAPMIWRGRDQTVSTSTQKITKHELLDPIAVSACPMIYQHEVKKRCEYRVVVLGQEIVAVEIDSQATPVTSMDWRAGNYKNLAVKQVKLEEALEQRLRDYMRISGLVFASFDIARDIAGDAIFFESNQQGQFLWIEELNPEIPILEKFVRFILSGSALFSDIEPMHDRATLADFTSSGHMRTYLDNLRHEHVVPKNAGRELIHRDIDSGWVGGQAG